LNQDKYLSLQQTTVKLTEIVPCRTWTGFLNLQYLCLHFTILFLASLDTSHSLLHAFNLYIFHIALASSD